MYYLSQEEDPVRDTPRYVNVCFLRWTDVHIDALRFEDSFQSPYS